MEITRWQINEEVLRQWTSRNLCDTSKTPVSSASLTFDKHQPPIKINATLITQFRYNQEWNLGLSILLTWLPLVDPNMNRRKLLLSLSYIGWSSRCRFIFRERPLIVFVHQFCCVSGRTDFSLYTFLYKIKWKFKERCMLFCNRKYFQFNSSKH